MEAARGMISRSRFHEARLAGPPEQVYEAFTTSAGLSSWLADRAAADAALGGEFRLDRDGPPPIKGRYVVWDPDPFLGMTFEAERPSLVCLWLPYAPGGTTTHLSPEHRPFAPHPQSP